MITEEEKIIEEGQNKSAKEIIRMEQVLRESIRAYFKRLCCYYDADCEEKAFRLDIDVEDTMGLSSLQSIKYLAMYEDDEGIVRFSCGVYDEDAAWEEIDDYSIETLTYIIDELETIGVTT